jgi:tRNA-specific 2-thiouridylase
MNCGPHTAVAPLADRRVVVGLSGGVDSTLAAALLCEAGWDVIGMTLRLLPCTEPGERRSCCGVDGIAQARAAAARLAIPHYVLDCREVFEEHVLRPCWAEYAAGRTPNPCLLCNRFVKFGFLLDAARQLGATRVATGHYARLVPSADGDVSLRRGADRGKDQSYFLATLTAEQLAAALFPLGDLTKAEVRRQARERGFANADRADSQDVCFAVADGGFAEFLRRHVQAEARPGPVLEAGTDRPLGRHEGIHRFTVGQRRGTGVALGRPAWVKEIRAESATVVMTAEPAHLLAVGMSLDRLLWHGPPAPAAEALHGLVQTRYRQEPVACTLVPTAPAATASVRFARPVRAVAPGQIAVIYAEDQVRAAGRIVRIVPASAPHPRTSPPVNPSQP